MDLYIAGAAPVSHPKKLTSTMILNYPLFSKTTERNQASWYNKFMISKKSIAYLLQKGVKFPLFDVDGTLIEGGNRAHAESYDFALHTVYHQPTASVEEIQTHGMIDTQILIEILKLHGVSEENAKSKIDKATEAMAQYFEKHKENGTFVVLDGATDILDELKKREIPTGLLTGNVEEIGWGKIERAGIRDYFTFGAFGNLAYRRVDLIKVAQDRLEKMTNTKIPLRHFVIIGDTPLDVACAKAGGIEVIAVATGIYSRDELQKASADLVIDTLHETDKIRNFLKIQ